MKSKVISLRHKVGYFGNAEIWAEGKKRELVENGKVTFRYEVK